MKIVKYIINENGVPILFCQKILHSKVVDRAISAGYAIVHYDLIVEKFIVKCYGNSDSLKLNVKNGIVLLFKNT